MKKLLVIVAACMSLALCLAGCSGGGTEGSKANETADTVYYAGIYEVGTDLPAGTYLLSVEEGSEDATVTIFNDEDMTDEELFNMFKDKYQIKVKNGQMLKVHRATFTCVSVDDTPAEAETPEKSDEVKLNEDETPSSDVETYPAGLYQVGKDIPEGRYLLTRDQNEEFMKVYVWSDYSTTDPNEALFNEWFTSDEASVSVTDGQVLEVQNGTFVAA